jgi:hypothetical protein
MIDQFAVPKTVQVGAFVIEAKLYRITAFIFFPADMHRLVRITDQVDQVFQSLIFRRLISFCPSSRLRF